MRTYASYSDHPRHAGIVNRYLRAIGYLGLARVRQLFAGPR